jgi:hypothetical protein
VFRHIPTAKRIVTGSRTECGRHSAAVVAEKF